MSAKQTRKERAAEQRAKQQEASTAKQHKTPSSVRKPVGAPRSSPLVRGLSIILVLLVGVLYINTLSNDYALDDYGVILENEYTKQGTSGISTILTTGYRTSFTAGDNQLYRPLSKVMFAIEWSISPESPGLNHFMNVALFALTIVLLFKTLRLYISNSILIPFLTAALFAIHPIHTEVVANIKGRDDILCMLFFVVTAYYVFQFTKSKSNKHLIFAGVAFFLSFLSKESAITFLAVIPLMLYFFTSADKTDYLKTTGVLAGATVLFLVIRYAVLGTSPSAVPVIDNYIAGIDGFLTQRTTAIYIAGIYLWKLFVPHPLVCDASVSEMPIVGPGDWQFLVPFVIFAGAAVFAIMKLKSKNIFSFSILYFFITFSLVSNIPFLLGTNYGERLLYAPSLGICLAIAYALSKFLQKEEIVAANISDFFKANMKAFAVVGVMTVVYGLLVINRNAEWKDNDTLYGTDMQKSTNSAKLHYFYANHITQSEFLDKFPKGSPERRKLVDTAAIEFKKSLTLYPAYTDATQKLAEMYYEQGKIDSAELFYRRAVKLLPSSANYRNGFGRMLFEQGRLDEAQYEFEAAVRFSPAHSRALNNLASVHGTRGANYVNQIKTDSTRRDELIAKATTCYQTSLTYSLKAIQYDPNFATAYETCAITYSSLGDQANYQKYMQMAQQIKQATAQ